MRGAYVAPYFFLEQRYVVCAGSVYLAYLMEFLFRDMLGSSKDI